MFWLTIWNPECGVYIALAFLHTREGDGQTHTHRDLFIITPLLHAVTTISQENPEQIPDFLPHEETTKKS